MIRFFADEDFNGAITRGLVRREIDVVRVQDLGLRGAADEQVLEWAADAGRIVLTHDRATLIATAYERVRRRETMLGVIAVSQSLGVGRGILDIELIALCSEAGEWRDRVVYVPLS
jgi:hypothetical protein